MINKDFVLKLFQANRMISDIKAKFLFDDGDVGDTDYPLELTVQDNSLFNIECYPDRVLVTLKTKFLYMNVKEDLCVLYLLNEDFTDIKDVLMTYVPFFENEPLDVDNLFNNMKEVLQTNFNRFVMEYTVATGSFPLDITEISNDPFHLSTDRFYKVLQDALKFNHGTFRPRSFNVVENMITNACKRKLVVNNQSSVIIVRHPETSALFELRSWYIKDGETSFALMRCHDQTQKPFMGD